MKSRLLTLLLCFMAYGASAQITVNDNNVIGNFFIVRQGHDTIPNGITIGNAGASQQWDFASTVVEHTEDSMIFVNPSILPGSSQFPNANIGATFGMYDSTYVFMKKDATGMRMLGRVQVDMGVVTSFEYPSTIITFPSTMGTNFNVENDAELGRFNFGFDPDGTGPHAFVDSVKIIRRIDESSTIDGYGQISTPYGPFNVIRQNVVTTMTDTTMQLVNGNWELMSPTMETFVGMNAVTVEYEYTARWWSDNAAAKFPVMEMDHDGAGNVYSVTWLKTAPIAELSDMGNIDFTVYPNPASNQVNITTINSDITTVAFFDLKGSMVLQTELSNVESVIAVDSLNDGVYILKAFDQLGNIIAEEKLIVNK